MGMPGSSSIEGSTAVGYAPRPLQQPLISLLLEAQNPDGGWGYRVRASSAVEPSAWAMLALSTAFDRPELSQALDSGLRWLSATQLPDGSWPSFVGQCYGVWTTSVACGVCSVFLVQSPQYCEVSLVRGLDWLCRSVPGEGSWQSRIRFRLMPSNRLCAPGAYGWTWTRNKSRWVEPTAYALLVLRSAPPALLPGRAQARIERAERFLFDTRCHRGGWDLGDPPSPEADRMPQAWPTAWALMALSHHAERADVQEAVAWLESQAAQNKGLATRAATELCLQAYGRANGLLPDAPLAFEPPGFPDILTASWTALAVGSARQNHSVFLEGN